MSVLQSQGEYSRQILPWWALLAVLQMATTLENAHCYLRCMRGPDSWQTACPNQLDSLQPETWAQRWRSRRRLGLAGEQMSRTRGH